MIESAEAKVQLFAYTQLNPSYSFPKDDVSDSQTQRSVQDLVAFCARVSNPGNQMSFETTDRLVDYLVKNKHWSPLEMVSATLEIETTRDIARQLLRHRSFAFQEFSQRYANVESIDSGFRPREARLQDFKNRQNSIEHSDEYLDNQWRVVQDTAYEASMEAYRWAIDHGVAKEQARVVLMEGLTPSKLYVQGTLRSWVHYIELRTKPSTQKEHRILAWKCAQVIAPIFPRIDAFVQGD